MAQPATILAVDDELEFLDTLADLLRRRGWFVDTASNGYEALEKVGLTGYSLVILDMFMPLIDGLATLRRIRKIDPALPVVVLTADGRVDTVVEAMKLGAYDYLQKPVDWTRLEVAVNNGLLTRELRGEVSRLRGQLQSRYGFTSMVGHSSKMQAVFRSVDRVIASDVSVMLRGESGTGKELLARAIHFNGPRKDGAFVAVNCAAIPDGLLESELFGHEKGAFTGAVARRIGKFEQADGGTIFLDEVGEMSPATQVKLLRVLQERQIERVGGSGPIDVDVRVISATNKDLEEELRKGRFREDLYYRLNVYPIFLPPLRERREDIPALVGQFLEKYSKRHGRQVRSISAQAMDYLVHYDWPGNVRELENVMERSLLNTTGTTLLPEHLPIFVISSRGGSHGNGQPIDLRTAVRLTREILPLREVEKEVLAHAVKLSNYNLSHAASVLGIGRTTLYRKLEKYNIPLVRQ